MDYYDSNGKRHRETLKANTTLKKAKEKLREIEERIDRGIYIPEKKVPKFSEVAEDWLQTKKTNIRETTWAVYECHVRRHLSAFNQVKINRITPADIEKLIDGLQSRMVNILTIRKTMTVLGQIMKYAVRHRYISFNPFTDAEKPRQRQGAEVEEKKIGCLIPMKSHVCWMQLKIQNLKCWCSWAL